MDKIKYRDTDQYIAAFPPEVKEGLETLRAAIREAAPESEEVISYNMPAFRLKSVLVYFAAYKNHIGFYPTNNPIKVFKKDLVKYHTSKGAIQFPIDEPLPLALVKRIVKFRVREVMIGKKSLQPAAGSRQ